MIEMNCINKMISLDNKWKKKMKNQTKNSQKNANVYWINKIILKKKPINHLL